MKDETLSSYYKRLNGKIKKAFCHDAGFLSIEYLPDVLQKYGYKDLAKTLLYQDKNPSMRTYVWHGARKKVKEFTKY